MHTRPLLLLALACGGGTADTDPAPVAQYTWHDDVAPIVAEHCAKCHTDGGAAPFALDSYAASSAWAELSAVKIEGDPQSPPYQMPPWFAIDTDECTPPADWVGDERLSEAQIATFRGWTDGGKPEGEPKPFPEIPQTPFTGEALTAAGAFEVPAEGEDLYRCFPLDPGLTETGWITGMQVQPDATDVVHHVVVFSDPTNAGASKVEANGSYPCFGSANVPDQTVLFAWAPGSDPLVVPPDAGIPTEPGSGIVMQVHYHPSGEVRSDQSSLLLSWAESQPSRVAFMQAYGVIEESHTNLPQLLDPPFHIPANASDHEERMIFDLDVPSGADIRLWSVFSHMHLAGLDFRVSVRRGDEDVCLAHNPTWDFDWQRTYVYDAPFEELPQVLPGDQLDVRCRYDNSTNNPALMEALAAEGISSPIDFEAGEFTTQEMCVAILGVVY